MASPYIQPPPGLVTPPGLHAQSDLSVFSGFSPIIYQSGGVFYYEDPTTGTMMTIEQPGAQLWTERYAGQPIYTPAPRRRQNFQPRKNSTGLCSVSEDSISIGSIVQLPRPSSDGENPLTCLKTGKQLDPQGYGHPVIIIDIKRNPVSNKLVALCCIISGNPKPSPFDPAVGARLPIDKHTESMGPRPPYVNSTFREEDIMVLETRRMLKQSYILTGHLYAISIEFLKAFSKPWDHRLSANSYKRLRQHLDLPERDWIDTELCATGRVPDWERGIFTPLASSSTTATRTLSDAAVLEKQMERNFLANATRQFSYTYNRY